ncbi:MAG: methyltransferase domain-containing protein [Candidatus Aminicenantes bacterium]|nr:methyltransferase domain-containing protein [Candidatus Aminicenantes bacterium]
MKKNINQKSQRVYDTYLVSLIKENFLKNHLALYKRCITDITPPCYPTTNDFSIKGRGESYLTSVIDHPYAREEGVRSLLAMLSCNDENYVILDVFGGNAYIARLAKLLNYKGTIITNDISSYMVEITIKDKYPTTWQSADNLHCIRYKSLNGILFAYGAHHLPINRRIDAYKEAYRVLKKNGKFVLHDFSNESSMVKYFKNVVDQFSSTGHNFTHFDETETKNLLTGIGFKNIRSMKIRDDFVFHAKNQNQVLGKCAEYVYYMYCLEKIGDINDPKTKTLILNSVREILGLRVKIFNDQYQCKLNREALVITGNK